MNELISIRENKGKQVVSARELYLSLGYDSSNYSRWVKSNIIENPYSIEGEDWTPLVTNASLLIRTLTQQKIMR